MKLSKSVLLFLILIIFCNAYGQQGQEYHNSAFLYSIVFPIGWKYNVAKEEYHVVRCEFTEVDSLNNSKNGTISVMVINQDESRKLEQTASSYLSIIKLLGKNIEEIKREETTLNGEMAYYHEYTFNWKKDGNPDKQIDVKYYLLRNNRLYTVYYLGSEVIYKKYKETIINSLRSFKFI